MNKIIPNSPNSAISIKAGDFDGKCSKRCSFDASEKIGKERIPLHRPQDILNLLTNLPILQTIHIPALTLFLHLSLP